MRTIVAGTAVRASGSKLPQITVHLLGQMRAFDQNGRNVLPKGRKSRAVLAILCLAEGKTVSRGKIAGLLWDRVPECQARASLRQALHDLASSLDYANSGLLAIGRDEVRLDVGQCWVDALTALQTESGANFPFEGHQGAEYSLSARLLDDLDGIAPSFDQWAAGERTRFESTVLLRLEADLHCAITIDDLNARVGAAQRLLTFDPTHEHAWQTLIRTLDERGDRAQALRTYDRCREELRRLLDIEPCELTRSLADALRTSPTRTTSQIRSLKSPNTLVRKELSSGRSNGELFNDQNRHRPRVGILSFTTFGSGSDEIAAHSLAQEFAAALALFRWFDVIAPISIPSLRGSPDWKRALDQIGLDYAVDGTIRISGGQLHVSAVLLDIRDLARTIWNARFEADLNTHNDIEWAIISPLAARVEPILLMLEGSRCGTQNLLPENFLKHDTTALVLSAIPRLYSMERQSYDQAGRLLARAVEQGSDDAMAHAWAAFWHVFHVGQGWSRDPTASLQEAERLCVRAKRLDPANAQAFGIHAHICSFLHKDFDSALSLFDRSLKLNPNLAFIWALSAPTFCYVGDPSQALERLERYRFLTPLDPYFPLFETIYTLAYTFAADYERAVAVGRRAVRANPDFTNGYKPLLAALGHLGLFAEAELYRDRLLELEPAFSLQSFVETYPFRRAEDRTRYVEGLRLAGVPEA